MTQAFKAKLHKSILAKHSALEDSVASALLEVENSSSENKTDLRDLQISKVLE